MAKNAVLGAGYGMGWRTFKAQVLKQSGVEISEELAKRCIEAYRKKNKKIVLFWEAINNVVVKVITTKKPDTLSCLKFTLDDGALLIHLPSGRHLTYPEACIRKTKTPWGQPINAVHFKAQFGVDWGWESTYGGKLTENVTQAIACDLMAFGLLSAEKAGYHPIGLIHDELISEEEEGYRSIEDYIKTIIIKPKWAETMGIIPLTASGFESKRYRK